MSQQLLESLAQEHLKKDLPGMSIGDTIVATFRIVEGDKERTQDFQGVLISRSGSGINETIVLRKIVDGIGVERIIPLHTPLVAKYEIIRHGDARRAKLYYLRDREGKSQRLRDRRRGLKHVAGSGAVGAPPAPKA
jgi:large subunit ribosomal protein L19